MLAAISACTGQPSNTHTCDTLHVSGLTRQVLDGLETLTSLELLALEGGIFCDVPIDNSLKHFHTTSSQLQCAEGISHPQTLQTLAVVDSVLSGLHDMGVMACAALHKLICGICLIQAAQPAHSFGSSFAGTLPLLQFCPPSNTLLFHSAADTKWAHLLVSKDGDELSTGWLYGLTSLQGSLRFPSKDHSDCLQS